MAGYVSSYPTLWSVFDMLILSLQKGSQAKKEGKQREKGENGLTLITPVSHSL